jgi:tRNA(Met) cytidine acetyltransferase
MDVIERVTPPLLAEARATDERRLLVVTGAAAPAREGAVAALDSAGVDPADATYVGTADTPWETVAPDCAGRLLGTTHRAVVLDCHEACRPNALGRAVGAVDGGGLLVLLAPPLEEWPDRRDDFDASLAVPPYGVDAVEGNFRSRLVSLLVAHPGITVVDVDGEVRRDGLTDPPPRRPSPPPTPPADHRFPPGVYERCRTGDQVDAVAAFEAFLSTPEVDPSPPRESDLRALVLEADRGRGKSSAAGLAAGALALEGFDVLVTAPEYRNAAEVFARAWEVLDATGPGRRDRPDGPRRLETDRGRIRYERPATAAELPGAPDLVIVDEAAALPVRLLDRFLEAPAVAFATTVHGYEGAGRGFSVRFRDHLHEADHAVREVGMDEPIRYAPGDPVEVWAFRALLLDAGPAADQLIGDVTPGRATYRRLDAGDLVADEYLLREAFGLLVLAHYRTEPDDLARLLDAPNVSVRALTSGGHVVSVALLAREGGLSADLRARMYEGERVRGNMIPDVLTSQLRDERAGVPDGVRVLRIATHATVRSRGLGSHLLSRIREEFAADVDWLGTGYGATPDLLRFWRSNGFSAVHLSVRRNESSGEHSAVMLDPTSEAGRRLHDRHARWFLRRVPGMLADPLDAVDPDVVRGTLASVAAAPDPDLTDWEWRAVAGLSGGASTFDVAPRPLRRLALRYLADARSRSNEREATLTAREERLLVRKALQGRPWTDVAAELDYDSRAECMRALGAAARPLVSLYGPASVRREEDRFE